MALFVTWVLAIVPLTVTPGQANVTFAASGAVFGWRKTIRSGYALSPLAFSRQQLSGWDWVKCYFANE